MIQTLPALENLAQTLKKAKGHIAIVEITSIVNDEVLSSFRSVCTIKSSFLTEFEGSYETSSGIEGTRLHEGDKGIVLNLDDYNQLYIDEAAKIKERENEDLTAIEIKDMRSSMHIRLQVFKNKGDGNGY